MINLGSVDFRIEVPNLDKESLESYSSELFDKWEAYLSETLELDDFSISLEIQDGSIEGKGKLGTKLKNLVIGIGIYESFFAGLNVIKNQVTGAGSYLLEKATDPYKDTETSYSSHRRTGNLGQLERLFIKVERNEMSVDEAMAKAEAILGEEAQETPEFMDQLKEALENTPRIPEQMNFEIELIEDEENQNTDEPTPKPKRNNSTRAKVVPSLHNRVEIWKESKKGKKKIRVTQY